MNEKPINHNNNIKKAERILIIDLLYLGDLLFATPFIRNLCQNYPGARLDMVVNDNFFAIIEDIPYLDNIYPYNKDWSIVKSWQFGRDLSQNNYQLGINIHGNWRTALLMRIINPDYSIGFGGKGRGIFLDKQFETLNNKHMVEVYLQLLVDMGLKRYDNRGQEIKVSEEARTSIKRFLSQQGVKAGDKLIGLNTGGSWPTKRWTESGFAELADILQSRFKAKVVFLGGPGDVTRVNSIIDKMETEPLNAAGRTSLKELAALAEECDLVISGDSGPVHVTASVGTPTITIFGPSDETRYKPYGDNHLIVRKDMDCRPCGEHKCPRGHHNCMEEIKPEDIISKIDI